MMLLEQNAAEIVVLEDSDDEVAGHARLSSAELNGRVTHRAPQNPVTPANRLTWHHDLDGRSSGNPFQLALDPEEASHIPCPKVIEIDDSEAESINELEVGSEGASLTEKSRSTSRSNTLLPDSPTPERMWGSGHLNLLDDGRNYLEDEAFHGLDLARLDHDSPFTSIHTHLPPPPALLPPKVSTRKRRRSEKSYPSRRTPLDLEGFVEHRDFFEFNDIQFFPGCDVEIEGNEFMRVKVILLDHEHDEVSVRGHLFRSVPILEGMLERKRSEIFWVVEAAQGDPRSHSDQAMQTKRIELVIRRKEIILTNTNYPRFSQDGRLVCRWKYLTIYQPPRTPRRMNVIEHALIRLTEDEADKSFNQRDMALRRIWLGRKTDGGSGSGCTLEEREHRQKEEQLAKDAAKWVPKHPLPESMANMILSSGRRSNRMTPISIADYSRGLAASISPRDLIPSSPVIDLTGEAGTSDLVSNLHEVIIIGDDDEDEEEGNAPPGRDLSGSEHEVKIDEFWDSQITRASSIARVSPNGLNNMRRYTFGDAFSGCGGTSRGALMAGLQLDWSFDHDSRACQSYRKSFPATRIANTDVHNFTTDDRYGCPVDILHISPPCQYFSPAHTINGPQDESNVAANFSLLELIKKIRSRIITLENTAGLPTRHKDYLLPLIQQFTTHGYSIRWRTVNLVNYGIPQDRRRFLIIASCPGEALPGFPPPTHSSNIPETGLRPLTTIAASINHIPDTWPNHDITSRQRSTKSPYASNTQAKTITTSGGIGNYHPSGRRGFTAREIACLQTFPLEHMFADGLGITVLRRQIGNAVPPLFAKTLFEHIKKALMQADARMEDT